MSVDVVKKSLKPPIVIGLVMLVVGLAAGVGAGRFMGRGSVLVQKGDPAKGVAGPLKSLKLQRQAPDQFFSDPNDPWVRSGK